MCQCQAYKLTSLTTKYFPISMTTVFLSHLLFSLGVWKTFKRYWKWILEFEIVYFFACFDRFIFWNSSGFEKSFVRLTNACTKFSRKRKTESKMIDLAFGCHKHINLCDKTVKNPYFSVRWFMAEGVVNKCIWV